MRARFFAMLNELRLCVLAAGTKKGKNVNGAVRREKSREHLNVLWGALYCRRKLKWVKSGAGN